MNVLLRRTAVALVLAFGGAMLSASLRAEIVEQILVKVNGEIFTKTDLEARQIVALRQTGQQLDPKASDGQLRKMLNDVTPQLIVGVVDEILLVQRGRELGYSMGDEQFKNIVDSIKKDNKLETEEQFQAALKQENMTLPELRKTLEKQVIISRVQQAEVLGRVAVNDDEARRYYEAHKNEFTSPRTVTLREIFVSFGADPATATMAHDTAAREKASKIRERAVAGESFEKLAADLSDSASRTNAGLIGPLSLNDLSAEVRGIIESMKPGDVTDLLRSNRGYQILKLETISESQITPFEQARDDIGNRVFTDKRKEELQKYLDKIRAQAIIEWKNQDIRKAYEIGLQQSKAPRP
jgi:peptidyl-prolyl cis-trans isomerase SurA